MATKTLTDGERNYVSEARSYLIVLFEEAHPNADFHDVDAYADRVMDADDSMIKRMVSRNRRIPGGWNGFIASGGWPS
jgi:hypothetical protein